MTTNTSIDQFNSDSVGTFKLKTLGNKCLKISVQFWFLVAVLGQWFFAFYVLSFYGSSAAQGNLEAWNKVLPHGYIAGDTLGNITVIIHILLAAVIILGGPLQLLPQIRSRFPTFHRWNGRIYMPTVFLVSLSGLYMVWARGDDGFIRTMGISINAVFIMLFSIVALRCAIARNIVAHKRWALRLFLVVNGVWFFRVGLMFSLFLNGGPFGFDPATFKGPFLTFLNYAQYLIPLAVLELYFRTQGKVSALAKLSFATLLVGLTVAMGIGIFVAANAMWLPRI